METFVRKSVRLTLETGIDGQGNALTASRTLGRVKEDATVTNIMEVVDGVQQVIKFPIIEANSDERKILMSM